MIRIQSYKDLVAWSRAMDLAEACYRISDRFPLAERFGLTAQVRRAAVSIPSNIAEGHRQSNPIFLRHLLIALGSHAELETQMQLAVRLKYLTESDWQCAQEQLTRVGELLHGLARSVRSRQERQRD
jgi:four helix bundle protein